MNKIIPALAPSLISLLCLLCATQALAFYNPATGKWLSRDPAGEGSGVNLMAFDGNDMLNKRDYLGLAVTLKVIDILNGPRLGYCGDVKWVIKWGLDGAHRDGWVIQDITITWDIKDSAGNSILKVGPNGLSSPNHYWEAWSVSQGANQTSTDTFEWSEYDCYKGTVTFSGTARYYDGLTLPASFTPLNTQTMAGTLPATTQDPKLQGGTDPITHNLSIKWDCTQCRLGKKRTELVSRVPAAATQ